MVAYNGKRQLINDSCDDINGATGFNNVDNDDNENANDNNNSHPPVPKRMMNVHPGFQATRKVSRYNQSNAASTNNPLPVRMSLNDLQKLVSLEAALANGKKLLGMTTNMEKCKPVLPEEEENHKTLWELAMEVIAEGYDDFEINFQELKYDVKHGVYCISSPLVKNDFKIGCSCTDLKDRVKFQIGDFDESQAACLMTPMQIWNVIPDWIVEETIKLHLPLFHYDESHAETKKWDIKTYWAEFLCTAVTNCPAQIVGERFFQLPSELVREMFGLYLDEEE